ncbi:MAG: CoA pyrophosphatase [Proteobacteria bacterium]|nr:CoA pyrophosphatase [Pseudomonadota bacterium]
MAAANVLNNDIQVEMNLNFPNNDLISHIQEKLFEQRQRIKLFPDSSDNMAGQSAVLLPLGPRCKGYDNPNEPCVILNKRSENVRQSGDLCCPGGGVSPKMDKTLAKLLSLPYSPLTRWMFWTKCRKDHPNSSKKLSILCATSLRESFEEMRLNPFRVRFMGALPPQSLVLRNRFIFPMVGWVSRQKNFVPNREVDKIVFIPMQDLLDPANYGVFKLIRPEASDPALADLASYYPCFRHETPGETEILWGATYRIVMDFMEIIFGFVPPAAESLPEFEWHLSQNYF